MDMGKEVYAQKTDFIRLFWEKVVSDVSRWAWHTREQVINRKKPIFLKLALRKVIRRNRKCKTESFRGENYLRKKELGGTA